jgi:hypothetical protein
MDTDNIASWKRNLLTFGNFFSCNIENTALILHDSESKTATVVVGDKQLRINSVPNFMDNWIDYIKSKNIGRFIHLRMDHASWYMNLNLLKYAIIEDISESEYHVIYHFKGNGNFTIKTTDMETAANFLSV